MKKGFTIVELITSFVIISAVSILLFNIIFSLKELYISGDIKTSLLVKEGILTRKIYNDLDNKKLISVRACGVSCLDFEYETKKEGTTTREIIQLLIDVAGNNISYGNYNLKINKGAKISYSKNNHLDFNYINSVLYLNIPIRTSLIDEDFGIKIVKRIDNVDVDTRIKFKDATIVANGIAMGLNKINFDSEYFTTNSSFEPIYTANNKYALFAKIFHQEKSIDDTNVSFGDYNEFIKSNNNAKFSVLNSLETFRSIDKSSDLINEISTDDETKQELEYEFSNGYFELLLDYPGYNGSEELEHYNWWVQTSNFSNNKKLENSYSFNNYYSTNWIGGLKLLDNNNYFVTGSDDSYYLLGSKGNNEIVGPASIDSVDLYVRVDEYISKYSLCQLDDSAPDLNYTVTLNPNGGTISENSITVRYGSTLELPTPIKDNYSFIGWYTEANGGGTKITNETSITNDMELYAYYIKTVEEFAYTGSGQTFTIPYTGKYKLETWGAQGYSYNTTYIGGYGGYSTGISDMIKNDLLYINVGAQGTGGCDSNVNYGSSYNGGGEFKHSDTSSTACGTGGYIYCAGSGGGATHMALVSGELKNLESYKGTLIDNTYYNSNKILIVAGGGGGAEKSIGPCTCAQGGWSGGSGGGYQSNKGQEQNMNGNVSYNATQTSGYQFGLGGRQNNSTGPTGGGGWYGGNLGGCCAGGGGGSGYIASSNLISSNEITKHMTCYNCTTSNDVSTKTESNTCHNSTATSDCAKEGHGYARITYLGE